MERLLSYVRARVFLLWSSLRLLWSIFCFTTDAYKHSKTKHPASPAHKKTNLCRVGRVNYETAPWAPAPLVMASSPFSLLLVSSSKVSEFYPSDIPVFLRHLFIKTYLFSTVFPENCFSVNSLWWKSLLRRKTTWIIRSFEFIEIGSTWNYQLWNYNLFSLKSKSFLPLTGIIDTFLLVLFTGKKF